jgi:class 3 adenylate cyclase
MYFEIEAFSLPALYSYRRMLGIISNAQQVISICSSKPLLPYTGFSRKKNNFWGLAMTDPPSSGADSGFSGSKGRCQLRAILFADADGFSRRMRLNEEAALTAIQHEIDMIRRLVSMHHGLLCSCHGDGLLATFGSARDAVSCAMAIQRGDPEAGSADRIRFRIGLHIGDVFMLGGQAMGDSVNVCSRIEALAEPGGILVSRPVFEALRGFTALRFLSVGCPYLKNIGDDLELFRVLEAGAMPQPGRFFLRLIGRFALTDADGTEYALPREGQALIAMVALSDGGARSRGWLQDTLWDDHPADRRPQRLAAAIARLQSALGDAFAELLRIDARAVSLAGAAVATDIAEVRKHGWTSERPLAELLEGCGLPGPAFNAWLRAERSHLRNAVCLMAAGRSAGMRGRLVDRRAPCPDLPIRHFAMALLPSFVEADDSQAGFVANLMADCLVRSLAEAGVVEIQDYRDGLGQRLAGADAPQSPGPDLLLRFRAGSSAGMVQITLTALRTEDHRLVWAQSVTADRRDFVALAGEGGAGFVGFATGALLTVLANNRHMDDQASHTAAKLAVNAVRQLHAGDEPPGCGRPNPALDRWYWLGDRKASLTPDAMNGETAPDPSLPFNGGGLVDARRRPGID